MDLRHAAFVDAENAADFLHGHFGAVVERNHFLITLRQSLHRDAQDAAQLFAGADGIRVRFGLAREIRRRQIIAFVGAGGGRNQTDVAQVQHHAAPAFLIDAQLLRDFHFGGIALQGGGQLASGGFHLFVAAAHIARGPVELPQAVEDRALDAVLGVARKSNLFVGVVLAGGVEQAENAGVDQVVHIDVHRQVLVHANRDGFHQRQMLQHYAVAPGELGALLSGA